MVTTDWTTIEPFVKSILVSLGVGLSVSGSWVWRAWRQRREDQQDDAEDARRDSLTKALDDQIKSERDRIQNRNKALEEQHTYDLHSIYTYQMHLVLYKQEIMFLRKEIDARRKAGGEQPAEFSELPALPQPELNHAPLPKTD
jgi:hypothetical protein